MRAESVWLDAIRTEDMFACASGMPATIWRMHTTASRAVAATCSSRMQLRSVIAMSQCKSLMQCQAALVSNTVQQISHPQAHVARTGGSAARIDSC